MSMIYLNSRIQIRFNFLILFGLPSTAWGGLNIHDLFELPDPDPAHLSGSAWKGAYISMIYLSSRIRIRFILSGVSGSAWGGLHSLPGRQRWAMNRCSSRRGPGPPGRWKGCSGSCRGCRRTVAPAHPTPGLSRPGPALSSTRFAPYSQFCCKKRAESRFWGPYSRNFFLVNFSFILFSDIYVKN